MDMKVSDLETCCLAYDKQFDQLKERIVSDPTCASKKDRVRSIVCRSNSSDIVLVTLGWSHRSPLGVLKWRDGDRSVPSPSLPCSTRYSGRGKHLSRQMIILRTRSFRCLVAAGLDAVDHRRVHRSPGHRSHALANEESRCRTVEFVRCSAVALRLFEEFLRGNESECGSAAYRSRISVSQITELLLADGADVNATDKYKQTPLDRCCSKGNTKIVELLLKQDALDLSMHKDCDGDHSAVARMQGT